MIRPSLVPRPGGGVRWLRAAAVVAVVLPVLLVGWAAAVSAAPGASAEPVALVVPAPPVAVAATTPGGPAGELEIDPSWGEAPGQDKVQELLDFAAQAGLVCCLLAVVAGGAAMGIGKLSGSAAAGSRGMVAVLGGGGGALVITLAPDIINWLVG